GAQGGRQRSAREPERRRDRAWSPAGHVWSAVASNGSVAAASAAATLRAGHDVHRRRPGHGDHHRASVEPPHPSTVRNPMKSITRVLLPLFAASSLAGQATGTQAMDQVIRSIESKRDTYADVAKQIWSFAE